MDAWIAWMAFVVLTLTLSWAQFDVKSDRVAIN